MARSVLWVAVMRCCLVALAVLVASPAFAETSSPRPSVAMVTADPAPSTSLVQVDRSRPWLTRRRALHATITGVGGAGYFAIQYGGFKERLVSDDVWSTPPAFDRSVRNTLVWEDVERANKLADVTGYYAAPLFAIGSIAVAGWGHGLGRTLDDTIPVAQSAVAVGLFHHLVKLWVPRERPAQHFDGVKVEPESEQRYSFYSGHTSLAFSLAVSAGTVAHLRGYRAEPVIWATGLTLAGATAYLRIAADAHYTSDVLTGAALGSLAGILVPLLVHGDVLGERATIVPGGPGGAGATLIGRF